MDLQCFQIILLVGLGLRRLLPFWKRKGDIHNDIVYPDFFELLLCLAGDLVIFDSVGRRELRRIQHVPFLPFVRKRINRILEKTAITAGEMDDEAEAAAEGLDEQEDDIDRSV